MIIAVDTGGTKTLIASYLKSGKIGHSFKFPTPKDTHDYVQTLQQELENHFGDKKVEAIVIALPGIIKDGIAVWCKNLGWRNFDVRTGLQGVLGNAPIFVENDANLGGLGETRALSETPPFALYVTVSTGIGSGIIVDGAIHPALRNAEMGHCLVEYDGRVQEWETFASGRAIYRTYGKYARDITSKRTWHQIADRISRGFLATIPALQPDLIIIGGSIGTYFSQFSHDLKGLLEEHLPDHIPCPKIVQAGHPEEAVIYGCYYYGRDILAGKTAR